MNAEIVEFQTTFPVESRVTAGNLAVERRQFAALVIHMPRQIVLLLETTATVAHKRLPRDRLAPLPTNRIGYHQRIIYTTHKKKREKPLQ